MLTKNRTEEMVFHLMRSTKKSFHFGDISLGVLKLLDAIKKEGFIVQYREKNGDPELKLMNKAECEKRGIEFEHCIR
jgi:hypothetical protein